MTTTEPTASASEPSSNPAPADPTTSEPSSLLSDYTNKAGGAVPIVDPYASDTYPIVPIYPVDPANSFYQV